MHVCLLINHKKDEKLMVVKCFTWSATMRHIEVVTEWHKGRWMGALSTSLLHLEGLASLQSPFTSGSYILSVSSLQDSQSPKGEVWKEITYLEVSATRYIRLCLLSICRSLYMFPSTIRGSFSDDVWGRHWSMSVAEECH